MKKRKFVGIVWVVMLLLMGVPVWGETHVFYYNSSVSPLRNKAAEYAYEILNYEWTTSKTILRYKGKDDYGNYITSGKTTGTIHGVPYNVSGGDSFYGWWHDRTQTEKETQNNSYYMTYGMVCASLVTDCIRQGFPNENLNVDHSCLFHKRGIWKGKISSVTDDENILFKKNHEKMEWQSIWTDIKYAQSVSKYPAYQKLKRGDYLDNWNHVVLVIDNYPEAQTLTCIDQSLCYYTPEESDRVGTRIRYSVSYGEFSKGNYVPMYVTYPDDKPDGIKISDTFPDELFREYVSYWDINKDGYFSDDEIDKVTDFGWYGGPHPDNEYENAWPYWEPKGVLESRVGKDHWKGIKSVEGVKIFKNLEALYVYNDNITGTLDVSGMTKLKDLRCWNDTYAGGNITEINAQGCTALEHLECQGNKLTSLNVYGCTALNHLECQDNRLTYLNTTNCTSLKEIRMWNNSFTSITLSNLPSLEELWAADCKSMKKLYVKNNPKMTRLYVDKNSALEEIYASGSGKLNSFLFDGCNSLKKFERDASVNLSAYVPKITTESLPRGYVGENYSATVKASGIGVITYSGTATFVANGFYFYGGSLYTENTTGKIRGVPVTAATRSYTITASNFAGSTSKNYSITVINNGKGPKITTAFLSNGVKGRYYSVPIAETGGIAPITWARVSGTLPPGTKLGTSGRTVYLSGTPTATGTYKFRVQAADSTSTPVLRLPLYDMKEFTVRIRNPLAFSDGIRDGLQGSSGQGFGSGVVKQAYTGKITVSGGASPYTLSNSGTLPDGLKLSLSGSTVTLSGLPTKAGKYTFSVKIKDSDGNLLEKTYTVNVTQTTISGTIPSTVARGASVAWTLTASGGTSPYTWSIDSGKLPDGLSINKSTGKITGKPTKAGTYTFVIKATDANKVADSKSYTVKVTQTTITGTFANGVVNEKCYIVITVEGGTPPYTWTKTSGTIPPGLKLTFSGAKAILSGTPTKAGSYTFSLKVTDKNGAAATKSYTVKITQTAISGTFTATGIVKAKYTSTLTVGGGTADYTWTKASGTLPAGLKLTFSGAKATLSGTPTKAGSYTFSLKVTDKNGVAATKSYTVKITQTAISGTFATGIVKAKYNSTITISGGTAGYTWTKASGTIPAGLKLTFSGAKATLSGTPTKAGSYTFSLKVTDKNGVAATKSYPVKITQTAISGTFTATGIVKAKYNSTITVSGGTAGYTWTKASGTIPAGLKLTFSGAKATLSGTPTKAGSYTFSLKVTDKNGVAATKSYTVKITQTAISGTFANGVVKAKYTSTITVSGGTADYTWAKDSGTLPTGLKLTYSGAKATLSGTPTKAGSYTFSLKVTDKNGVAATKSYTVKVTQTAISGVFTATGIVKAKYNSTITVGGGTASYTWAKDSGTLPTGLKLTYSGAKATLSGTPTKAGSYTFSLKVTDKNGVAATKSYTVKITQTAISGTFTANGIVKAKYSSAITVGGGTAGYTWTKASGTLPAGLKLTYSGAKATLSGTPTKAGSYTFSLKVTDKNGVAATKSYTVKITQTAISGAFTATGIVKAKYNSTITVGGGTAGYTWTKASGTLPAGLKLTYSGAKATLSGTPTKAGSYTFTIEVKDKNGAVATKKFTVQITEAQSVTKSQPDVATARPQETPTGQTADKTLAEAVTAPVSVKSALPGGGTGSVNLPAALSVFSEDIVEAYDGKDSDLVRVRENTPVRFIVSNWGTKVSSQVVYVDDKPLEGITISDEGMFTLPSEFVRGDFKVCVKSQSESGTLESEELFIIAE